MAWMGRHPFLFVPTPAKKALLFALFYRFILGVERGPRLFFEVFV